MKAREILESLLKLNKEELELEVLKTHPDKSGVLYELNLPRVKVDNNDKFIVV